MAIYYHWWQWRRRFLVNRYVRQKPCAFFTLKTVGRRWRVRACICVMVSARVCGRVLSYAKSPFWKFCWDVACADTNVLSKTVLYSQLTELKNQFRHTHKQICAVWMMQRNLYWLGQGLVRLNIWNWQHVGLSPVKWIFENCVKGSLNSCAAR